MDDYFMTEVGKVEDGEASKSSSSSGNKKPVTKKVMKFCYEPEMEEICVVHAISLFGNDLWKGWRERALCD
ncbi:hypothetical protein JHK82_035743 [Glycine max]|nr:hypothetical protein JHK87_035668 [Glycine soja]KAG4976401.1 hypothetical protein JHK86_035875 [Glycine max]KAG5112474.1 hypothetical protein JHK82_035743 [Glycine max]KAG5129750.1 hypothetical protein JHK84_036147 [Glycine max]